MTRVRIGVIGAGLIGRKHIATIAASSEADLVGIADQLPPSTSSEIPAGIPYFSSHEELLDATKPEAVVIATPNNLHVPIGIECARRKVHMLVEKPVAESVDAAIRLLEEARHADVRILVGHHRRHALPVQEAKKIIASGRIGKLVGVTVIWATRKPDPYFDAAWRRVQGGGPVLINLIHEIDNLRYIGGEISSVFGRVSNQIRGFEVEDSAGAVLCFENGAIGTILCSDAAVSPWTIEQGLGENPNFPFSGENSYRFIGTTGALDFPNLRLWSHRYEDQVGWDKPLVGEPIKLGDRDAYREQLRHFCAVVRREEPARVSGEDGTRTLAATLAILESVSSNQPIELSEAFARISGR